MLVLYPQLIEAVCSFYIVSISYPLLTFSLQSDVVCANAFPFWENIEASKAAAYFKKRFQPILDLAGNKKVIITETGWATSGKHENASIASEENAGVSSL
jgi:exo-beta-1,3-glucanase (GH17 family)